MADFKQISVATEDYDEYEELRLLINQVEGGKLKMPQVLHKAMKLLKKQYEAEGEES